MCCVDVAPLFIVVGIGYCAGFLYDGSRARRNIVLLLVIPALLAGGLYSYIVDIPGDFSPDFTWNVLTFAVGAAAYAMGFIIAYLRWSGRPLYAPATQDEANCARCGYPLRGLEVPRCPECGRPFDPRALSKRVQ